MKDEVAGEVPVAFVVISNGSKISEDDIKHYISQQVLSFANQYLHTSTSKHPLLLSVMLYTYMVFQYDFLYK